MKHTPDPLYPLFPILKVDSREAKDLFVGRLALLDGWLKLALTDTGISSQNLPPFFGGIWGLRGRRLLLRCVWRAV